MSQRIWNWRIGHGIFWKKSLGKLFSRKPSSSSTTKQSSERNFPNRWLASWKNGETPKLSASLCIYWIKIICAWSRRLRRTHSVWVRKQTFSNLEQNSQSDCLRLKKSIRLKLSMKMKSKTATDCVKLICPSMLSWSEQLGVDGGRQEARKTDQAQKRTRFRNIFANTYEQHRQRSPMLEKLFLALCSIPPTSTM